MQPISLGKVSTNAGTPVSLIQNFPSYTSLWSNRLEVQALKANTQAVYVGTSTLDRTTLAGVYAILQPGESWVLEYKPGGNVYLPSDYYLDVAVSSEGAVVNCIQA